MISILIDGREAVLSADFSFQLTRSNPFFDGAGDYTYEVELSLLNRTNAQIYSGINRPNSKSYPTGRKVVVRDDLKTLLTGTEILLDKKDATVRIQIVANESQFNLEGGSKYLADLNLPNPVVPSTDSVADSRRYSSVASGCYPLQTYALPLMYKEDPGLVNDRNVESYNLCPYSSSNKYIPQPYLLWVIDKVVENMGYTIGYNYLTSVEKYKHLCIVNCVLYDDIGVRLPNWTVDEFFTELEKFFGVIFQFDSLTHVLDIVTVDDFYSRTSIQYISNENILDSFDFDSAGKTNSFNSQYLNVGYSGGSSDFWTLADIDDNLYRSVRKVNKLITSESVTDPDNFDEYDQVIFKDTEKDIEWIFYNKGEEGQYRIKNTIVNQFKSHCEDEDVSMTSLKIIPAINKTSAYILTEGGSFVKIGLIPSSVVDSPGTFSEILRGDKNKGSDVMEVAYSIMAKPRNILNGEVIEDRDEFPIAITSSYNQYGNMVIPFGDDKLGDDYLDYTLALNGDHGRVVQELKNSVTIDTTQKFTFKFLCNGLISAKPIFLIRGRKYICAELRYNIENCKLSRIVEGDFYPMK